MTVGVWIRWIFWFCSVFTLNTTNVFKMERFTFKSGEFSFQHFWSHSKKSSNRWTTTNILLKPLFCGKYHAITSKCHNSYGANFEFSPFFKKNVSILPWVTLLKWEISYCILTVPFFTKPSKLLSTQFGRSHLSSARTKISNFQLILIILIRTQIFRDWKLWCRKKLVISGLKYLEIKM